MKKRITTYPDRIIAERLEPRVLFSADPLGLAVGALLIDDQDTFDTTLSFEPFSEINIGAPEADHAAAPVELIFIDIRADSSREDIQAILVQDHGNAIVHVIDPQTGGIDSISTIIAQYDAVSSIHFLVHGDNQGLRIGADWLDVDSIDGFKNQLTSWDQYLTNDADVLLYGCNLTAGSDGLSLIGQLATLTGADVAASNNTTGHAERGGDWELENSTGVIETKSIGTERLQQEWNGSLDLIVVTTPDDVVDMDITTTPEQLNNNSVNHKGADGLISLREAVIAANNTVGADEIMLDADTYTLDLSTYGETEDNAQTGDLDIRQDIVISGATTGVTRISGNNEDRIFDFFDDQTVLLQNLTLQNGELSEPDNGDGHGAGAAIRIFGGDTTLSHVTIENNITTTGHGGAIWLKSGELTIENSIIRDNESALDGGAIDVSFEDAALTIFNTEINHNIAGLDGGGIAAHHATNINIISSHIHHNDAALNGGGLFYETNGSPTSGVVTIETSTLNDNDANNGGGAYLFSNIANLNGVTFSDNDAVQSGGGLTVLSGVATIDHSTFARNSAGAGAQQDGDAIKVDIENGPTSLTIGSSIIAENRSGDNRPEISGPVTSSGFNLIEDSIVGIDHFSDLEVADAGIGNLASTADKPPTHTLNNDSPAIDAGGPRAGVDANGFMPNTFSDIGAVEADPTAIGRKLFWADSNGWIYRANEDGSAIQQIFQTDNPPKDIEYDSGTGRIFWSETDGQWGSIRSTDINGNDLQEITSSTIGDRLMSPTGIAIDAAGRFLYAHADYVISPANGVFGQTNTIDRYTINNDGTLTFESEIFAGSPFTDPQISQAVELEYTTNLDGREALIWNDVGNEAVGAIPETVPQINLWDLTPGPNTNPNNSIVPIPEGKFDPRGLAVDTATGAVYFSVVDDDVVGMTVDLDTQVGNYFEVEKDKDLFGLEFDDSTDTLWWTEIEGANGHIGTFNSDATFGADLDSYNYLVSYDGAPIAVALADITPINTAPVATEDSYIVNEGGTLAHATDSVLDNDTDADASGDLTATLVSGPSNATAFTLNSDGTFSYTHNGSETTTDSFTYTANDAATGVSAVTTVTLTVTPVNDNDPVAVADAYTLAEGATLAHATNSVLDNDTDADTPNDTMDAILVSGPANAAAFTLNSDGTFSYTHNGSETTTDSFTYTANDAATGVSAVTTVTLTVTPVNDNDPVAVADAYTLDEGGTLAHTTNSVLDNDTDVDTPNDAISAALITGPANATAFTLNSDGTFSYTHNGSETTSDSFTYTAIDAIGHSSTATVLITVVPINDPPEGANDTFAVLEGTPFIADVLANDSDADGDTLSAVLDTGPSHGSVTLNPDNTFTYEYDGSTETADSFTYVATDGTGNSLTTTVTINITGTNDAPQAVADNFITFEGIPFTGTVLNNDTDEDGDALTPSTVVSPMFGSLVWNTDNTFTYEHNGTENFTDSFTYIVTDGISDSAPATVTIDVTPVNDAPNAVDDTDNVNEGELSRQLVGNVSSILANDSDPENENLSASIVEGPSHGNLTLDASTGMFVYEHDGSETTQDSYTYAATDASGASSEATVTITVKEINDDPEAEDDEYTVSEGGLLAHPSASVLDNDTDAENDALIAELIGAGPANALSFELFANGTFSYQHDGSETTSDSFTYIARDSRTGESTQTSVNIIISEADDTPTGVSDLYNVDEGGLLNHPTASVLDNDTDAENDVLTAELLTGPSNSTAFSLQENGQFSYHHDGSETTEDTFTYIAKDQNNVSTEVEVTITINPINDIPVPVSSTATELNVPSAGTLILPDNLFIDAEDEPLVYSVVESTVENDIAKPGLPGWLEFTPEDRSFDVTDLESATSISVVIVATDPNNGTSEHKTIELTFAPRLGAVTTDEASVPEAVVSIPVVEQLAEEVVEPQPAVAASLPESTNTVGISINEATDFKHIDIASLIKPLPAIAAESASAATDFLADLATSAPDDAVLSNNIEQLTFELLSTQSFDRGLDSLAESFDEQKELLEEAYNQSRTAIGRSITLTSGLSVGYLIWLIRGGTLMGSVLSSMPAWRLVDPLPILSSMGDDLGDSDDSLESMVENTE